SFGVPVLELLEPSRPRRAPNPLFEGADAFARLDNTRFAWYARNFLLDAAATEEQPAVTRAMQKDLELFKLRVLECRAPREHDVWLHSALRVAQTTNPFLTWDDLAPLWSRVQATRCFPALHDFQRRWIALFRAVAARDAPRMAEHASALLGSQGDAGIDAHEYLLAAAMAGHIAAGNRDAALAVWRAHGERARRAPAA